MFIIAEVGSNHNRDLDRARALIEMAARAGCSAVKFQLYTGARLYAPGHQPAGLLELPPEWLYELGLLAHARNMEFGCSVFSPDDVHRAAPFCDFVKVSSYSVLDLTLLRTVCRYLLPVILSTGMASDAEVSAAVRVLNAGGHLRFLLHCVSQYPCPPAACNLSRIGHLHKSFPRIGYSDHSATPAVVLHAALRHGARAVELHVDLDDLAGSESAGKHCWTEQMLASLLPALNLDRDLVDGLPEGPYACERAERNWRADPLDGLRPMRSARS